MVTSCECRVIPTGAVRDDFGHETEPQSCVYRIYYLVTYPKVSNSNRGSDFSSPLVEMQALSIDIVRSRLQPQIMPKCHPDMCSIKGTYLLWKTITLEGQGYKRCSWMAVYRTFNMLTSVTTKTQISLDHCFSLWEMPVSLLAVKSYNYK